MRVALGQSAEFQKSKENKETRREKNKKQRNKATEYKGTRMYPIRSIQGLRCTVDVVVEKRKKMATPRIMIPKLIPRGYLRVEVSKSKRKEKEPTYKTRKYSTDLALYDGA
jgi:hypothetical protein